MANKGRKETHSGLSPHHLSFQNFTLRLLPTKKEIMLLKRSHSLLMAFQRPTPCPFLTSQECHPPSSLPYFWLITCLQNALLLLAKRQIHLQRRALFIIERHLMPKPPFLFPKQMSSTLLSEVFSQEPHCPIENPFEYALTLNQPALACKKTTWNRLAYWKLYFELE